MPAEARLEQVGNGLAPVTDGWFVVNARDAAWGEHDVFGRRCKFDTDGRVASARPGLEPTMFPEIGYTLTVLHPGKPSGLYHAEDAQEDLFVVSGSCLAIVEDEERQLTRYDFLHCPAGTSHVFVGGPAEVAYYAQIAPLHAMLNVPMPRVTLRGHVLVAPRSRSLRTIPRIARSVSFPKWYSMWPIERLIERATA